MKTGKNRSNRNATRRYNKTGKGVQNNKGNINNTRKAPYKYKTNYYEYSNTSINANSSDDIAKRNNCRKILSRPSWTWELVVCFAWGFFPYITTRGKFISQSQVKHDENMRHVRENTKKRQQKNKIDVFFETLTPRQTKDLSKITPHSYNKQKPQS